MVRGASDSNGAGRRRGPYVPAVPFHQTPQWKAVEALIAQAVREGRHGPPQFYCDGCGRLTAGGVYHVTESRQRWCKGCHDQRVAPVNAPIAMPPAQPQRQPQPKPQRRRAA